VLLLNNGKFASCSDDKTIRIWNFDKTIPEKVLRGHTDVVLNIIMLQSGLLRNASLDGTIKIWNIENVTCEKTLPGKSGRVLPLVELPDDILISGGENQICFWNLQKSDDTMRMKTFYNKGYCNAIILLNSQEMACGAGNDIKIFKIDRSGVPVKTFEGHRDTVRDLLLNTDRQHLLSTSDDLTMRMWNFKIGSCVRAFTGGSKPYRMAWFKENVVVTGYGNGEIKFWDIHTGECVRALKGQLNAVAKLVVDMDGVLISYGYGPTLTL